MAKDPALLFYPQDFLTGTMFMSNEQVGIYIRLLCAQHQHGGLIDKNSFNGMVKDDNLIRSKFVETEDGFFNERLMEEMNKRAKKSSNLSKNAKARWDKYKLNANALQKDMPTENEDVDTTVIPTTSINTKYREQLFSNSQAVDRIMITFRDNGIKHDREHIEKLAIIFCNEVDAKNDDKQTVKLWSSHFVSWAKKNHEQYKPKARQGLQHG